VKLRISNFSFDTTDHFTEFISGFRYLETLAVSGLSCVTIVSPSLLSLPGNLGVVEVSDNLSTRWLLSFQHLPSIHFISKSEYDPSTSHILRTFGASLETVGLACHRMFFSSPNSVPIHITPKVPSSDRFIDLRHNIRLRLLHLELWAIGAEFAEGIASILSRVVSMHIDTVSLSIPDEYRWFGFNWGKIDEALAQPTFAKLRRVEITIRLKGYSPPFDMVPIVDCLPECHTKGILFVDGKFGHEYVSKLGFPL
jgi:hypothetical protein